MKIELFQPYSFCQIGRRNNQEDARFPDEDRPSPDAPCFVVCDGVGGEENGEVASRVVCDAFGEYMDRVKPNEAFTADNFQNALSFVYNRLLEIMEMKGRGMATTLTFLCFHEEGVLAAHIGDSRIYHIRPQVGVLYRSNDHSLVNAWVHSGNITPEAGIRHPKNNYITRFLGYVGEDAGLLAADVIQLNDIEPGDYFFLCTDGVIQLLDEEKLQDILDGKECDEYKMKLIADICRNSSDNNTACLIPVQAVSVGDDGDIPLWNVDEREEKNVTLLLAKPHPVITEVGPVKDDSLKTRFVDFLKNLFK